MCFSGICEMLDNLWGFIESETPLFDIPIVSNLLSMVINIFWGLFGCDFCVL
ncbi:MAG: hypothetical protein JXR94_18680 [Candidatus Hydrogenedentes bacterium]|nr:hypothetical protein [Candidatus Hydrogenedentota bacterium]